MSESKTTSASNWKIIRDGEVGRQGVRWEKGHFHFGLFSLFWAVKGLMFNVLCFGY